MSGHTHTHTLSDGTFPYGPQIEEGRLCFQLDCDNSADVLGISGRPINDGRWHAATLELTQNSTLLSLDDSYVESRRAARAPLPIWPLATDGSLFFGAQVSRGARLAACCWERKQRECIGL